MVRDWQQNRAHALHASARKARKNARFYSFGQKESLQSDKIRTEGLSSTLAGTERPATRSHARSVRICARSAQKRKFLKFVFVLCMYSFLNFRTFLTVLIVTKGFRSSRSKLTRLMKQPEMYIFLHEFLTFLTVLIVTKGFWSF